MATMASLVTLSQKTKQKVWCIYHLIFTIIFKLVKKLNDYTSKLVHDKRILTLRTYSQMIMQKSTATSQ